MVQAKREVSELSKWAWHVQERETTSVMRGWQIRKSVRDEGREENMGLVRPSSLGFIQPKVGLALPSSFFSATL